MNVNHFNIVLRTTISGRGKKTNLAEFVLASIEEKFQPLLLSR